MFLVRGIDNGSPTQWRDEITARHRVPGPPHTVVVLQLRLNSLAPSHVRPVLAKKLNILISASTKTTEGQADRDQTAVGRCGDFHLCGVK